MVLPKRGDDYSQLVELIGSKINKNAPIFIGAFFYVSASSLGRKVDCGDLFRHRIIPQRAFTNVGDHLVC